MSEGFSARVVSLDRPSERGQQLELREKLRSQANGSLRNFEWCITSTVEEFRRALEDPVGLLMVSAHGTWDGSIGFGRDEWAPISSLHGQCENLLVIACSQTPELAAMWAEQFSAKSVVHATGEPQGATAVRAIGRVITRPGTWSSGEAVLNAVLDSPRPAKKHRAAGWGVHRTSGSG